ncbi:UNVERIFIED_CONTAM: hypothetical protein PYX00_003816 [Menopon gallinae]|uniref:Trimethyllysine dioxygenase, mitochondrial n=1 Tax=Menopon gallinae TaxID=328185 RepID=A0AAW2I3H8_9NEOP
MFRLTFDITTRYSVINRSNKTWNYALRVERYCSTSVTKIDQDKCLKITNGQRSNNYYYLWLRDHCRCDKCYNSITAQRKLNIDEIPTDVKVETAGIDNGVLKVTWEGGHESRYPISWLESCLFENYRKLLRREYKLWDGSDVTHASIARVDHDELLKSDARLTDLMRSLVDYGVGFVKNAPVSLEGTETAIRRIGPVQTTFFGGMWEFSDELDHSDTAYTREGLEGHNDNTYFTESAGLQVLHCLHHTGEGGETILIDGFKAASILKERHSDVFDRLSATAVGAEYIEEGQHHVNVSPILKLNPITGEMEQIRFNLNDRAPLVLPQEQIPLHYNDLRVLTKILRDPGLEWKFKLTPGTIMIIDNFRLLHGRKPYTGSRKMCGCYMGRTDFLSKARVLKILQK